MLDTQHKTPTVDVLLQGNECYRGQTRRAIARACTALVCDTSVYLNRFDTLASAKLGEPINDTMVAYDLEGLIVVIDKPQSVVPSSANLLEIVTNPNNIYTPELSDLDLSEDTYPEQLLSTSLSEDIIKDYFKVAGRRPILTAEQEVLYMQQIEAGLFAREAIEQPNNTSIATAAELQTVIEVGDTAYQAMVESNLRLVVSIAKRFIGHGLEFIDLIQEGNIGLIRAIDTYDINKGFKFSVFAKHWISNKIRIALANQSNIVRLPLGMFNNVQKLSIEQKDFYQEFQREPSIPELASRLFMTDHEVAQILQAQKGTNVHSLSSQLNEDGVELGDVLIDEYSESYIDVILANNTNTQISNLLSDLETEQQLIIMYKFGFDGNKPKTNEEISEILELSVDKVGLIYRKALSHLKHPSRALVISNIVSSGNYTFGQPWSNKAICSQTDPQIFHPGTGRLDNVNAAKKVCNSCYAGNDCLNYALESNQQFGIWGGTTREERTAIKKAEVFKQL